MSCAFGAACASVVFLASMLISRSLDPATSPSPHKPKSNPHDKSANAPAPDAPAPSPSPSTAATGSSAFTVRLTVSALAALCLALSKQIWIYSLQSEVFALNNLLCAAILYCALLALSTSSVTAMKCGAFFTGLGVCHQHTSIFISIPSVLAIFAASPGVVWTNRNSLMLCGVLGLLPYLYLPIQYKFFAFGPYVNWGDVMSPSGFFHHFVRGDYGTFQLASDNLTAKIGYLHRISVFLGVSLHEMQAICVAGFLGALYSIVSLLSLPLLSRRKSKPPPPPKAAEDSSTCRRLLLFLSCVWVSYTLVFCYLSNLDLSGLHWGVHARFTMQTNVVIALGGAAFTQLLLLRVLQRHSSLLSFATIAAMLASLCFSVHTTYPEVDFSSDTFLYSFGKDVLRGMKPSSLLLTAGDVNCNIIDYLQQCEHFRLDITVLCMPRMAYHWFPKIASDLEPRERDNRKRLHLPSNPAIHWPNGTLFTRDVKDKHYSMQHFFTKNFDRFSAVYNYGGSQDIVGGLQSFAVRTEGFASQYIRLLPGKDKGSKVDPTYRDLPAFVSDNIKGFTRHLPLSSYAAMLNKPQYSDDTWEYFWIQGAEAQVHQFLGELLKLSTQWMPEHQSPSDNLWLPPALAFMDDFIQAFGPDMTASRRGQKLCYRGFMRFTAAFYKADTDQEPLARLNNLVASRADLRQCVSLQKQSKYEDTMIATYESTCLPWLQQQLEELAASKDFELASAAQQLLTQ